jgi:hypothetical protein
MKQLFALIITMFFTASLTGQSAVLDSRQVSWAGTACLAYPIDFPDSLVWAVGYYAADAVKIAADRFPQYNPKNFLATKLFADVWSGALPAYQLAATPQRKLFTIWDSLAADQQRPLTRDDWEAWVLDRLGDDEAASRIASSVERVRFRTFYWFDKRKRNLLGRVDGALIDLRHPATESAHMVVWIPFRNQGDGMGFPTAPENPAYAYVGDVTRIIDFETDVVTVKGTVPALMRDWVWQPLEKRKRKAYAFREDAVARQKAVQFQTFWQQNAVRRDTVITFDPDNYEERVEVIDHTIYTERVTRASVQQRFFYDDRRKAMFVAIRMVSPAVPRYDSNGNFRFDVPLVHVPLVKN